MDEFAYVALTASGQKRRGQISAESKRDAVLRLREQKMTALAITRNRKWRLLGQSAADSIWMKEIHLGPKVKSGEFAVFSRQMAALIRAGVPLANTVQVLAGQADNKALGKALADMAQQILKGHQLSAAVTNHRGIFPAVFTNMVRSGEASGDLDDVLERLAVFFEKEHFAREKIKSALTYPIIVSVLAVVVSVFLLVKVVPTFVSVFASYHIQLPLPTRIMIAVSDFIVHQWYLALVFVVFLLLGWKLAVRNPGVRYWRDYALLKVPVIGQLTLKSCIARMGRAMSSLLASGVPIIQTLHLTASVVENEALEKALHESQEGLTAGESLSEPLQKSKLFPPLVMQMIQVGEETGNLDFMLSKIADFYETETEAMVDRMKSLIEPLMILGLSVVVGTIIIAVLSPMFSLYSQVGNMN